MSANSSNLNLNATNQQNIVLNQQNLINRGNIIVNQTQNTQNLILNQTNIMQNSQNIILNHASPQNIVLNQNNLLSRPPSVQNQKQSPLHPSPCQSPYQIFNTNATMVGSNNLSLISNFPPNSGGFASNFHQQASVIQSNNGVNPCMQNKNMAPSLNIVSNMSTNLQANISSNLVGNQSITSQIGTKLNQSMTITSNNMPSAGNHGTNFSSNYSNPSPISNPLNSPYSNQILSPSNSVSSVSNMKSPVQSPSPILRPTTPQPIIQQAFQQIPVMTSGPNHQLVQIIHTPNNGTSYQNHTLLGRQQIIAPTTHIQTNTSSIVKIKQPLNILPKPPTANNPNGCGNNTKNNNRNNHNQNNQQTNNSAQIVLPNQALLPQGQTGTLVLNQMPLIVQQNTPQGIQLVLRPSTPSGAQLTNQRTAQNLILQQNNAAQPTVLIQHNSRPTPIQQQPQQLVRVLTANSMIQQLTPTFIAMNGQPLNLQQLSQQKGPNSHLITNQNQQNLNIQAQNMAALSACIPNLNQITQQLMQQSQQQPLNVTNNSSNIVHQNTQHITTVNALNVAATTTQQGITGNNLNSNATQIINAVATNTTNVANALQTSMSVLQPNSTTAHLNNLTMMKDENTNDLHTTGNMTNVSTSTVTVLPPPKKKPKKKKKVKETKLDLANLMKLSGIGDEDDNMYLESDTSDSSSTMSVPHLNTTVNSSDQNTFPQQPVVSPVPKTPSPCVIATPKQSPSIQNHMGDPQISSNQLFTPVLNQTPIQKIQSQEFSLSQGDISNLMSFPSQIGSIQISAITDGSINSKNLQKTPHIVVANNAANHPGGMIHHPQNFSSPRVTNPSQVQNLNIPSQIGNIQISQICSPSNSSPATVVQNSGAVVNSSMLPHNQQGIIVQHGSSSNAAQVHNVTPNISNLNINQPPQNTNVPPPPPLGGFKLAMAEDGRILLQHDPTLHQDLQSQMLLQQIFGLNMVQPNIVFTSTPAQSLPPNISSQSQITSQGQQHKISENFQQKSPNTNAVIAGNITKTINSIQHTVATPKIENSGQLVFNEPLVLAPSNVNGQLMLSLSAEQLDQLKSNPQFNVNGGPTLVFNNANNISQHNLTSKTSINSNVLNVNNKSNTSVLVQHLNAKMPLKITNENVYTNQMLVKPNITTSPKAAGKVTKKLNKHVTSPMTSNSSTMKSPKNVKTALQDILAVKNNTFTAIPNCPTSIPLQSIATSSAASQTNTKNQTIVASLISQANTSPMIKTVSNLTNTVASSMPTSTSSICSSSSKDDLGGMAQNSMPPLIAVSLPKSMETMIHTSSSVMSAGLNMPQLVPLPNSNTNTCITTSQPNVFQRVQTIQLTAQKQQQLKSVQLQIQALSSRLQNKTLSDGGSKIGDSTIKPNENSNVMSDTEIQIALQRLFHEQQKILATGKLLPSMAGQSVYTNTNCIPEVNLTGSSNTANTKPSNANQFISNLLQQSSAIPRSQNNQQPTMSVTSAPKVYYHHLGNQIIQVNPNHIQTSIQNHNVGSSSILTPASGTTTTASSLESTKVSTTPSVVGNYSTSTNKMTPLILQTQNSIDKPSPQVATETQETSQKIFSTNGTNVTGLNIIGNVGTISNQKQILISPNSRNSKRPPPPVTRPTIQRSVLIEQQLSMDQTEAANPDIHMPFSSKADACKRLVRYHCFNQPVLSLKDLDKADEIFEMTARHFIDKFYNMVNKYKSLRLLESMREVPTSELMMIDRMFITGEQQELEKLRAEKLQRDLEGTGCDISIANLIKNENLMATNSELRFMHHQGTSEIKLDTKSNVVHPLKDIEQKIKSETPDFEYDEWLCIQKELGYVTDKSMPTKTDIKMETRSDEFDIENNIKTFEIRSSGDAKRAFNDSERSNESAKRVCTNDSREKLKDTQTNQVPIALPALPCTTGTKTYAELSDVSKMDTTLGDKIAIGVENSKQQALAAKFATIAMETSTNSKPVNSENEVFRTQTSFKKTLISVSTNLTSHSVSNSSVSQSKLSISQNAMSHHDIDLELELGLDQLLKNTHLDLDENIDAQVQSAIDSILNLQQRSEGSINMNAILSSNQSGSIGEESDRNAQFINDLLGVQPGAVGKKSGELSRRNSRSDKTDVIFFEALSDEKNAHKDSAKAEMDSFSECSSPDDALDQAVRSILS